MKTFTYSYRDRSGALKRASLQALDRSDALRQIRALNYVPVSVSEGKMSVSPKLTKTPSWMYASLLAVVCVVVVTVIGIRLLTYLKPRNVHTSDPIHQTKQTQRGDRSQQAPHQTPLSLPSQNALGKPASPPLATQASAAAPRMSSPAVAPHPSPTETVVPPEEPKRPTPFKTGTEQFLAIIKNTPLGTQMPPLPEFNGMENDYARASTNTLEIFETDSDELAKKIESVAWAKVELADLVKQGWKPDEVLTELTRKHNEEASMRTAAALALKKMVDSGELSAAALKSELQLINKELAERGLPEITNPDIGVAEE